MKLTMEHLKNTIEAAKKNDAKFFGILVKMEGFPEDEVIINGANNFDGKLAYYQKVYGEDLSHKFSNSISIVGFTFGNSFEQIQNDLV